MTISIESSADYALFEYNRDPEFRTYVDTVINHCIQVGKVKTGLPLRDLLMYRIDEEEEPLGCIVLQAFHGRIAQDQYNRARNLSGGNGNGGRRY